MRYSIKIKLLLFVSVFLFTLLIPQSLITPQAKAYLEGRINVNSVFTSDKMPTITGTMPAWCNDIVIGIGTDQQSKWTYFYSDHNQIQVIDNGYNDTSWSFDLRANNYGLINGVYSLLTVSACGYPSYSDPLYADLHYSIINIVPSSCDSYCVPVYRFYNTLNGAHFYTTNENEKRNVLNMPQYTFEGISSYGKYFRSAPPSTLPVYRFYNLKQGVHFYTINQAEASNINDTQYQTYRFEGVAYYTYPYSEYAATPVHRFYKFNQGVHFYTSNQAEATNINITQFNTYRYEGVAYYNIANIN